MVTRKPTTLTDELVAGGAEGREEMAAAVMDAMLPRLTAMVAGRLSPTPAQWHATEDIVQECMMAMVSGLGRLENRTVMGLRAFASTIAARKVADYLKCRGGGRRFFSRRASDKIGS